MRGGHHTNHHLQNCLVSAAAQMSVATRRCSSINWGSAKSSGTSNGIRMNDTWTLLQEKLNLATKGKQEQARCAVLPQRLLATLRAPRPMLMTGEIIDVARPYTTQASWLVRSPIRIRRSRAKLTVGGHCGLIKTNSQSTKQISYTIET